MLSSKFQLFSSVARGQGFTRVNDYSLKYTRADFRQKLFTTLTAQRFAGGILFTVILNNSKRLASETHKNEESQEYWVVPTDGLPIDRLSITKLPSSAIPEKEIPMFIIGFHL